MLVMDWVKDCRVTSLHFMIMPRYAGPAASLRLPPGSCDEGRAGSAEIDGGKGLRPIIILLENHTPDKFKDFGIFS